MSIDFGLVWDDGLAGLAYPGAEEQWDQVSSGPQCQKDVDLLQQLHKDAQRVGAPLLWRQDKRPVIVQPGEASGRLSSTFQCLKGATRELGRGVLPGHVVIGQGEMASNGQRAGLD